MINTLFRQIQGVTLLALRASIRTRVVMFLVLLQVICALALPRVLQGDGTPAGDLDILLTYTLGFAFAIQTMATLWSCCSLFAGEISSLRIQMTAVKPTGFAVLWFGRWLALLLLNAALLALIYSLVYFQIRRVQHREGWGPEVIPAARHVARPLLPSPEEDALRIFERMKSAGKLPEDLTESEILKTLEEQECERYDIINPGDELRLNFVLVREVSPDEEILLRIKFDTEYSTRSHVKGVFRLQVAGVPDDFIEVPLDSVTSNEITIPFKVSEFIKGSEKGDLPRKFMLSFIYSDQDKKAPALMLRLRQDVVLMIPGGSFEMNLVRSAFVQWSVLAVLAAFGLALSACFSFPVASFTATVVLALIMIAGGVLPMVTKEDEKQWSNRVGVEVLRSVRYLTRHTNESTPLYSVVRGERIGRSTLLLAAFWNLGLMPLALAVFACATLRRRELANV